MPEPAQTGQRYVPGLDGLRALAVLAVIAYHLNLGWAPGGLLGVGVFFTLSGYLITDLLLGQQFRSGSLKMPDFWKRRARRLLPALFVMLAVVVGWVALFDQAQLPALRGPVFAASTYISNWWLIVHNSSYFARFGPPSPLGHLWSLAVEEQFYLIWPWLLWLGLRLTAKRGERTRAGLLASATLVLAAGSAVAMAVLYHPGYDPTRVYDGTDTRAFALLIGAALAFLRPSRKLTADVSPASRRLLDAAGAAGLVVILLMIWRVGEYSAFLYRGGMVLLSVATALVVWAVVAPAGLVGRVLGWGPLRWLGVRSYGIYLWHYPIIVLTTPASGKESLLRGALQVSASIVVAALSWRFIEEPIRHGAIGRWWAQLRSPARPRSAVRRGLVGMACACCGVIVAGASLAGVTTAASAGQAGIPSVTAVSVPGQLIPGGAPSAGPPPPPVRADVPQTSCRSVVHLGDSTSDGLVSADYLPNPAQRIGAQYADVGVRSVHYGISGGTSIVETLPGTVNAYTAAQRFIRHGYRGCWVLALGTNDTADVFVGSNVGLAARITRMMTLIGNEPVMWVNVVSLLSSGPYSEHDMRLWDQALLRACPRYPNMRVYNWAAVAKRAWFISDGIHYTSAGYAQRAHLIASALATAFPQNPPMQGASRSETEVLGQAAASQDACLVN